MWLFVPIADGPDEHRLPPPPSAAKRPSDAPPPVALRAALQLTAALLFTVGSALFIPALYVRVPRTGCCPGVSRRTSWIIPQCFPTHHPPPLCALYSESWEVINWWFLIFIFIYFEEKYCRRSRMCFVLFITVLTSVVIFSSWEVCCSPAESDTVPTPSPCRWLEPRWANQGTFERGPGWAEQPKKEYDSFWLFASKGGHKQARC